MHGFNSLIANSHIPHKSQMLNYTPQTQEGQELREVYSFLRETVRANPKFMWRSRKLCAQQGPSSVCYSGLPKHWDRTGPRTALYGPLLLCPVVQPDGCTSKVVGVLHTQHLFKCSSTILVNYFDILCGNVEIVFKNSLTCISKCWINTFWMFYFFIKINIFILNLVLLYKM